MMRGAWNGGDDEERVGRGPGGMEERDFAREADVPERAVRSYSAPITLPHFQKFDSPRHYLTPALFRPFYLPTRSSRQRGSLLIAVNEPHE